MPDKSMIGAKLKKLRTAQHLTQEELAKRVGVTTSLISMYESGERVPSDPVKVMLAKELKRSVAFIFFKD